MLEGATPAGDRRFDVVGRRCGDGGRPVAAIDLGSNNCRLLVARPSARRFQVIDAFSRIVRLGEGLGDSGRLSDAAIDRTVKALAICTSKMRRRGVGWHRAVATEACRRAANTDELRDRVATATGLQLDVISPGEEARLAVRGCAELFDEDRGHALMFDIGGGSTELIWLKVTAGGARPIDSISLPIGVVNLAERHGGGAISPAAYRQVIGETTTSLAHFDRRHGIAACVASGQVQMLGSSGTVTTLAGIVRRLPRYDRSVIDGSYLEIAEIHGLCDRLLAMSPDERTAHPCIGTDRAELVMAGCAVVEAICRLWPVTRLRIADRGLREGILLDLIAGRRGRRLPVAARAGGG